MEAGDPGVTYCPRSEEEKVQKKFSYKPEIYARLSQPKHQPKSHCQHSGCSDSDSNQNPGGNHPKKNNPNPTTPRKNNPYFDYIYSDVFMVESPPVAIKKCAELALKSSNESVKAFWLTNQTYLFKLISDGQIASLRMIMPEIRRNIQNAVSFMSGIAAGLSIAKTDESQKLMTTLSTMVDTLKTSSKRTQDEAIAHQKQTLEFVNQINNASETVANFQRAVEKVKLAALKLDITPAPIKTDEVLQELPQIGDISTPSSVFEPEGQLIEKIRDSGAYHCQYATVKVGTETILSFSAHTKELKALNAIIGRSISFGLQVLNRSLEHLSARSAHDVDWNLLLRKLIPKDPMGDKEPMIRALRSIPIKTYQWYKKDMEVESVMLVLRRCPLHTLRASGVRVSLGARPTSGSRRVQTYNLLSFSLSRIIADG